MLEEKFICDKIDEETYHRHLFELRQQRENLSISIKETTYEISNHRKFIDYGLEISSKLSEMWEFGEYNTRLAIQKLLFPEGIYYLRENATYRPIRVNSIMNLITSLSNTSEVEDLQLNSHKMSYTQMVGPAGHDPATP